MQVVNSAEQTTTEVTCSSVKKSNIEHEMQYGPPHSISSRAKDLVKESVAEVEILEPVDSSSEIHVHCHLNDDGSMSCSVKNENEQQTNTASDIRPCTGLLNYYSGGVSVELQSVMDQLEVEQNRWKEQLTREQQEREVISIVLYQWPLYIIGTCRY